MKKPQWILFLLVLGLSISCTNDEGDTDFEVLNPTEEEEGIIKSETLKREDSKN